MKLHEFMQRVQMAVRDDLYKDYEIVESCLAPMEKALSFSFDGQRIILRFEEK